ncbi:MAG: hypothetical protein FWC41_10555 [Firmicutes bacterium]|nr:hypothetical protein [Bacillota bacterium]
MNTDIDFTDDIKFDSALTSSRELKEIIKLRVVKHIMQPDAITEEFSNQTA